MKMLKHLFLPGLLILVFACNKDDDTTPGNSIVGTWSVTAVTCDDGQSTTTTGGVSFTATFTFYGKDITSKLTFNEDGTFTNSGTYTQVLSTTFNGQTTEQEIVMSDFSSSGTWEATETTLTLNTDGQAPQTATIVEMSGNTLKFDYLLNTTETQGASTATSTATIQYTLEKQ